METPSILMTSRIIDCQLKFVFLCFTGTKFINILTSSDTYNMYIHLEDFEGNSRYAEYSEFHIGDATTKYTLTVTGYSGTAGIAYGFKFLM